MKIIVPDYYKEFRCIASACRHTCCAGWEIDIDKESALRYENLEGPLGERLRSAMEPAPLDEKNDENYAHFRLLPGDRCPFLNEDNLCDLILKLGEGSLCQICADHPRFRNFWTDRIEMGLGLACEEAARIILTQPEPMKLTELDGGCEAAGLLDADPWEEELPFDEQWLMDERRELFADAASRSYAHPAEQRLLEYLIWRHIADALYDDRLEERVDFIDRSFEKITKEWHTSGFPDVEGLIEICRRFSNEIEYSVEDSLSGA